MFKHAANPSVEVERIRGTICKFAQVYNFPYHCLTVCAWLFNKKKAEPVREGGRLQHKRNIKDKNRKCCSSHLSLMREAER